jgi:5-methylcytosine-specific restriction endonuclease McrA
LESFADYATYLKSARWRELREQAVVRDLGRCRTCNTTEELEVHHRRYPAIWGEETVEDLTTLCRTCHEIITAHLERQRFRKRLPVAVDTVRLTPTQESKGGHGLQQTELSDYRRVTPT